MKIVFDARLHFPVISGMSRYIVNLLTHLLAIDPVNEYIVLVNPKLPGNDELFLLKKYANISFQTVYLPHMGIANYTRMPAVIRALNPDIYHYPHIDAPIVKGVKTVATIHDANISGKIKKFEDRLGLKGLYFRKTLDNTLRKADSVIFISNAAKKEILSGYKDADSSKFQLVYNGFDQDFGKIDAATISSVQQKFKLDKPYFLYVGQMRIHKNIQRMIAAFLKTNSDWEFILVGNNYMKLDFSKYPSNVRYLDIVSEEELKGLYYHSKAFVFPSYIEGFGFPILESLSYCKPVIGTNYGAIAEISDKFLIGVDPDSEEDISSKMADFMKQQPAFFSQEECDAYIGKFDWVKCAQEVLSIYGKL